MKETFYSVPNSARVSRDDNRSRVVAEPSRRGFMKALAVAGAGSLLPAGGLLAQIGSSGNVTMAGRIDVHHHMYPPFYVKAMEESARASGFTARQWTPATSLDLMDKHGIATAMLSPIQRLVMDSMSDGSEKARSLARQNNEYGAQVVRDHPTRFGHFAALPLPDADGSVKEIAYSLDVLKADGIALWTSYLDKWVGDPAFWPAFEELNRRGAIVFYHPARATCCRGIPGQSGIIEYDIDTARAIDSMLWNGTLSKFPKVRHIFSHAGGAFAVLAARIIDDFPKNRADKVPNGVEYEIKKLYFDTAHAGRPAALDALKNTVSVSQIMYGSDVPIRGYELTDDPLEQYAGFSANDWKAINRGNAEKMFPRLRA